MSADDQGGAGRREVAYRVFAAEYDDADFSYSESDEERAPNYVVLPTGARVNRLFTVGVLTETERASEEVLRARIVDPTGAFVVYAGQYQPDALTFLERADPPSFVALTGKARTFQPEDSEVTYTSIRPESANEVDAGTRDRWTVTAAERTLERVRTTARALTYAERGDELRARLESEGVDAGLAAGIPLALDHYGTTATYLDAVRTTAIQAAEVVAGERDEVDPLDVRPDVQGSIDPETLVSAAPGADATSGATAPAGETTAQTTAAGPGGESGQGTTAESEVESESETEVVTEVETDPTTEGRSEAVAGTEDDSGETATAGTEAESGTTTGTATDSGETATGVGADTGTADVDADSVATTTDVDADSGAPDPIEDDAAADESLEDFEPGEFELDEEEREQIEAEYGTDFQSGTEVDAPGEADIETPAPETGPQSESETEAETGTGAGESAAADASGGGTAEERSGTEGTAADAEGTAAEAERTGPGNGDGAGAEATEPEVGEGEPETGDGSEAGEEPEDVDVEDAVMDAMREHDDGDGAARDDIVDAVTERWGASESDVEGAIQDALMDGRCYEPGDGVYKPI